MPKTTTRLTVQGLKRYSELNYDLPVSDNIQNLLIACKDCNIQLGRLTSWVWDRELVISYSNPVEYRSELDSVVSYLTALLNSAKQ